MGIKVNFLEARYCKYLIVTSKNTKSSIKAISPYFKQKGNENYLYIKINLSEWLNLNLIII